MDELILVFDKVFEYNLFNLMNMYFEYGGFIIVVIYIELVLNNCKDLYFKIDEMVNFDRVVEVNL